MVAPGLKERYINVYLPSAKVKEEWEEDAKKAGLTLSKYVFEAVEQFRSQDDQAYRYDFVKELADAKDKIQELSSNLMEKNLLLEKLKAEVYESRHAGFAETDPSSGIRQHDKDLIAILKRGKVVDGYLILKELGIDPRETDVVKLVNNQLESLRRFGLVEETALGWKWMR